MGKQKNKNIKDSFLKKNKIRRLSPLAIMTSYKASAIKKMWY